MRLAVLDIGSNSAHLRIVDTYPGSAPLPLYRHKAPTRLAETVDEDGALRPDGIARMLRAVGDLPDHPASDRQVKALRRHVKHLLAVPAQRLTQETAARRVVATSKTFNQLARLAGTTVDPRDRTRMLRRDELRRWIPRLAAMTPRERGALAGVAPERARQILAGAIAAESTMRMLKVSAVEICPWALREGILLRRLSPLLTPDSLQKIKLLQAAADPSAADPRYRRLAAVR